MKFHSHYDNIEQLQNAPLWGTSAIDGLLTAEASLEAALRYVPYCKKHGSVWSPEFGRIILECASQVDSLWKATGTSKKSKPKIEDHFKCHAALVQKQQVVLFSGSEPTLWAPFANWEAEKPPPWWSAYNKLKHDRFTHQELATLDNAIDSLGALLLAVVYSGKCDWAIVMGNLLDSGDHNPWASTESGLLRDVHCASKAKIESRLFAHPLGVFGSSRREFSNYWPSSSPRFTRWWVLNYQNIGSNK